VVARQQLAVEASGAGDVFAALPHGANTILGGDNFMMTTGQWVGVVYQKRRPMVFLFCIHIISLIILQLNGEV